MEEKLDINNLHVKKYLDRLINQPLRYGIKSPDMDLYDFGFGKDVPHFVRNDCRMDPEYAIHAVCRIRLSEADPQKFTEYDGETSAAVFAEAMRPRIGAVVRRYMLDSCSNLRLVFDDFSMTFCTYCDDEESWRFFRTGLEEPHLVAYWDGLALE